ncbi:MAG TPA: PIN domain-containing protein [Thermoanaerobaculia bacterium]|jgi:predicted nucleic acid-binding protein
MSDTDVEALDPETERVEEKTVPQACFVDTNVLVYATSSKAPLHQRASGELRRRSEAGQELWLSRQVLREYLATLSRPQTFAEPRPIRELVSDIRYFLSHFQLAEEGPEVTEKLLELIEKTRSGGKHVHDANLVATMLVNGISVLLTHNVEDFVRFGSLIEVAPLAGEP